MATVQKLYEVCKVSLSANGPLSPEAVDSVCSVLDNVMPSDVGLETEAQFVRRSPRVLNRKTVFHSSTTIKYRHIYECKNFSIGIFCIPASSIIPLHNHPGMTVFSKLLYGTVHVKSYDWVDDTTQLLKLSKARPAKIIRDGEMSAPCSSMVIQPTDGGNIHAFKAITPCAILDILSPPYSSEDGRHCSYFRRCRKADPSGGYSLMGCIKDIPTLKGDNYGEWKRKLDLAFILGEVDWVLTTPCPIAPAALVRGENESDAEWQKRERDNAPLIMSYDVEHTKWSLANKKCLAVVKNTIEPTILGSIPECDAVSEYLERIKSQFTGSSKTYATQLIKQLVTERYHGGGVRDHILRMSNMASKLKPMDLGITDDFLVHLVMASLPKLFDNFVVNYNISPEKWNFEKLIANCVQEEERIKEANGGSINYVKDNKKKNYKTPSSKAKQPQHLPQQQQFTVEKDQCLHCKKTGHYKKDCPDFLKMIMAKKGIPFDEDYAKKRKIH